MVVLTADVFQLFIKYTWYTWYRMYVTDVCVVLYRYAVGEFHFQR